MKTQTQHNSAADAVPILSGMNDRESRYEAPAIEQVISAEQMEREVHYAGGLTCAICDRLES